MLVDPDELILEGSCRAWNFEVQIFFLIDVILRFLEIFEAQESLLQYVEIDG